MEKPFKLVKISYDNGELNHHQYLALLRQKSKLYYCFVNKKILFPNKFNQTKIQFKPVEGNLKEDVILKPNIKEYITYALNIKQADLLQMEKNSNKKHKHN